MQSPCRLLLGSMITGINFHDHAFECIDPAFGTGKAHQLAQYVFDREIRSRSLARSSPQSRCSDTISRS
jgi:hypothetical protein